MLGRTGVIDFLRNRGVWWMGSRGLVVEDGVIDFLRNRGVWQDAQAMKDRLWSWNVEIPHLCGCARAAQGLDEGRCVSTAIFSSCGVGPACGFEHSCAVVDLWLRLVLSLRF